MQIQQHHSRPEASIVSVTLWIAYFTGNASLSRICSIALCASRGGVHTCTGFAECRKKSCSLVFALDMADFATRHSLSWILKPDAAEYVCLQV